MAKEGEWYRICIRSITIVQKEMETAVICVETCVCYETLIVCVEVCNFQEYILCISSAIQFVIWVW